MNTVLSEEVYNNDVFLVLLEYEVSRCKRYPAPLSLIQIEMMSHGPDPKALEVESKAFSKVLNAHLRSVDIPSRKKNIFTVLLPNSDVHGAQALCERLLSVFKKGLETPNGNKLIEFSLYIGGATHSGGPDISSEIILRQAGEALKQAKTKGANTYIFS
jgi:hypothetical protein